jgi:outer membrane protein assembly factor BamB
MRMRWFIVSAVLTLWPAPPLFAEEWPQFRGPSGAGLTSAAALPTEWGMEKNIAWKVELPGAAWSQPIVWGERIFVTTAITENQRKPRVGGGGFGGFGGRPGQRPGGFRPGGQGRPDQQDQGEGNRPDNQGQGDSPDQPRPGGGRPGGGRPGAFGPGGFGGFGRGAEPPNAVYQWKVLCLDASTGQVVWEQLAREGKPTIATHPSNTYASETPVTDGERIYCYFGMTGLFCYDLSGKLLWSKDLGTYRMQMGWGTGSSPALDGHRLFILCDNDEKSFLVALDKHSGNELWRVTRDEKSNYATPYIWRNKLRTEVVTAGANKMRSYDPATGKLLWELGGGRTQYASATPVGDLDLLYVGAGGGMGGKGPLTAVRAGAEGDITLKTGEKSSSAVAWSVPQAGPPMASPLLYEGSLYVLDQRGGIVSCYDAATGKQHYQKRIEGARGFTSSPWAHGGKVFCLDDGGQTFVLQAGPTFKLLATNKLDDSFWSSVAVAGDKLLLRGVDRLYCIGQ